jgi:two-component system KDP operon response regulator KdpE
MTGKKIMLVEDDKDNVRAMAVRLKSQGYSLVVATDAISAISTARKEKPDLIVLDLGLPGGDGFVVMQRMRSNYELMMTPIIVLSARDPFLNEERALEAGAEAFFQKPVENADFLAAIEKALSRSAHPV